MARIATITKREELAPENQQVFDSIAQSRGVVGGPWLALLHSPELAQRTQHLGTYVRFESTLDHKVVELTALVSARELDSKHEWAAHIIHGQKAGISMDTIRAVYEKKGAESFSSEDAQIVSFVREIIQTHRVSEADLSSDLWALWRERHGRANRHRRVLRDAGVHAQYFRRLYVYAAGRSDDLM